MTESIESPTALLARPLVSLAGCFLAGAGCGLRLGLEPGVVLSVALPAFTLGLVFWKFGTRRRAMNVVAQGAILLAVFWGAWARSAVWTVPQHRFERELGGVAPEVRVEVVGTVWSDTVTSVARRSGQPVQRFVLRVERFNPVGKNPSSRNALLEVVLFGAKGGRFPAYGERWQLRGRIERDAQAAGGATRTLNQMPRLLADGWHSRFISAGHGLWLKARCLEARRAAARALARGIESDPQAVGVMKAMLLGYRAELPRETRELMTATGIMHIFAVSGSHVAVIAVILQGLLRSMRLTRDRWVFVMAPLLASYAIATGGAASAVRACIMAVLFYLGPAVGRRQDAASAVALAAILIVGWNPGQLFEPGFIMSFVVVLGLIIMWPVGRTLLEYQWQKLRREPDAPTDFPGMLEEPERRLWRSRVLAFTESLLRRVSSLLVFSTAAWLSSVPLSAYFFQRVSLVSIASNMVAIPLAFLIMLAGALSLTAGSCVEWIGEIYNNAGLALTRLLVLAMQCFDRVPLACVPTPKPSPWLVVVWYLGLGALVLTTYPLVFHRISARAPDENLV
ncbi:MAG: ComEC/Rec2 family competence protein [Kiritimatiellia bacterium]